MAHISSQFNDVQKIIEILGFILVKVNLQTDVTWTQFDNPQELTAALTVDIEELKSGNLEILHKINIMFAPTGTYQELSISNGWGNEYIDLSHQFDLHYKQLKHE